LEVQTEGKQQVKKGVGREGGRLAEKKKPTSESWGKKSEGGIRAQQQHRKRDHQLELK